MKILVLYYVEYDNIDTVRGYKNKDWNEEM